jgi:hypothetical protein
MLKHADIQAAFYLAVTFILLVSWTIGSDVADAELRSLLDCVLPDPARSFQPHACLNHRLGGVDVAALRPRLADEPGGDREGLLYRR